MRMYVHKRVVPWSCVSEYEKVASSLKSSDLLVLKEAVMVMRVWLCRVNVSKIPRSVLCTYELMVARLEQSTPALALAIMRFISLASSEDQDRLRSPQAMPVSSLARKAGLPDWMSDLRNDIAHGHLPTHAFLDATYSVCIDWLEEFWRCNLPEAEMCSVDNIQKEIDWNHYPPEKLTEDLDSPLQARMVEQSFGTYASGLTKSGCLEPRNLHSLKKILRIFKHKNRICDVALNAFFRVTSSDDDGAFQWAKLWLAAFLAVRDGKDSALSEFIRPCDLTTFEWRPCLEHLCSVFSPKIMPRQVDGIKDFLTKTHRSDAKSVKIKTNKDNVKFKIRCSRFLYTLVVTEKEKVAKIRRAIPPTSDHCPSWPAVQEWAQWLTELANSPARATARPRPLEAHEVGFFPADTPRATVTTGGLNQVGVSGVVWASTPGMSDS
ncbi:unnamed protein product [Schistocephalus solidus]|uniref:Large ribosomal subunit protein eL38 n=1 Tax=Schistocephalus solidus TaxID=70667 RepID=A0A183TCM3_SCHSO|nr:unnamed protein product [Schistocephalus solidus]